VQRRVEHVLHNTRPTSSQCTHSTHTPQPHTVVSESGSDSSSSARSTSASARLSSSPLRTRLTLMRLYASLALSASSLSSSSVIDLTGVVLDVAAARAVDVDGVLAGAAADVDALRLFGLPAHAEITPLAHAHITRTCACRRHCRAISTRCCSCGSGRRFALRHSAPHRRCAAYTLTLIHTHQRNTHTHPRTPRGVHVRARCEQLLQHTRVAVEGGEVQRG
jgi:hypothetical protein